MPIILLILIVLALAIVALVNMYRHSATDALHQGNDTDANIQQQACSSQCGDTSCALDCLPKIPKDHPVYFDDEELDTFKGRASSAYSEDECQIFSEILYTMQEKEVPEWLSSLQQRGVALPDALKDEVVIILQELRNIEKK